MNAGRRRSCALPAAAPASSAHAENQPRRRSLARLRAAFDDRDLDAAADLVSGWIRADRIE